MLTKSSIKAMALTIVIAATSFGFSSCTSKITEEQMTTLRSLRGEERSLNETIQSKRDEISRLQGELQKRNAELKDCNERKAQLQGKLQQWPDVWPQ